MKKRIRVYEEKGGAGDVSAILADEMMTELTIDERIFVIKKSVFTAMKNFRLDGALGLFKLLKDVYKEKMKVRKICWAEVVKEFVETLMDLYWEFPNDSGFNESRKWILEEVDNEWAPGSTGPWSEKAIRFLCAVHSPIHSDDQRKFSEDEEKSRGYKTSKVECDKIEDLLRKHMEGVSPEYLEMWLKMPQLPLDILRLIAVARTKNGFPAITYEDIGASNLLRDFKLNERSPFVAQFLTETCKLLRETDAKIQEFVKQIQGDEELMDCVSPDNIKIKYVSVNSAWLNVHIERVDLRGRLEAVANLIEKHAEKWEHDGINLSISVIDDFSKAQVSYSNVG